MIETTITCDVCGRTINWLDNKKIGLRYGRPENLDNDFTTYDVCRPCLDRTKLEFKQIFRAFLNRNDRSQDAVSPHRSPLDDDLFEDF